MLTNLQNGMLTLLEKHCQDNKTGAWIGDTSALNGIGGRKVLYELEQAGAVSINRVGEKWIVIPQREYLFPEVGGLA